MIIKMMKNKIHAYFSYSDTPRGPTELESRLPSDDHDADGNIDLGQR